VTSAVSVGLDAYYKKVQQLIDEGQFGNALVFTPFNYAQGKVRGLELSVAGHGGGFTLYSNTALSRAEGKGIDSAQFNIDPAGLAYTQAHYIHLDHDQFITGSAGIAYAWNRTTVSLTDLYASGLRTDDPVTGVPNGAHLAFYNQLDAGVQQNLGAGVGLRLAGINLLDRIYQIRDGGGIGVGTPQFGPRRAAYIGLSKSFGG